MFNRFFNLSTLLLLATSPVLLAQSFVENEDYIPLAAPVSTQSEPGKVEVVEVFSYACPACMTFSPKLETWENSPAAANADVRLVHASFNPSYKLLAKGFIAADILGIAEQGHNGLFNALHVERKRFRNIDDLADFYSQYGVAKDKFIATANSFTAVTRLRKEERDINNYAIRSTPNMVVAGKYLITINQKVKTQEQMLDVVAFLVDKEYQAHIASAAPAEAAPEAQPEVVVEAVAE